MKVFFFALSFIILTFLQVEATSQNQTSEVVQMKTKPEKLILTWDQFDRDARNLGEKLREMGPWDGIIAVSRGGFVPVAIIANMLNLKNIDTVVLSSYDDTTNLQECQLKVLKSADPKPGKWVVIDDLVDTGNSAKKLKEMFPNATIACVYAKPQGKPWADITIKHIEQDQWIVFPWEPRD